MSRYAIPFESMDAILTALDSAHDMIAALNDGMFAPEEKVGAPLTLYPQGRLGMAYIMDAIAERIDAARRHLNHREAED